MIGVGIGMDVAFVAGRGVPHFPLDARVALEGDSITAGSAGPSYDQFFISKTGGRFFLPDNYNQAVGGTTAAQMAARTSNITDLNPKLVVFLGGTNDLSGTSDTPAEIAANIKTCIDAYIAAGARVAIVKVLPRNDAAWTAGMETNRLALNALIDAMASSLVKVVDLESVFDPTTMTVEGLHPNFAGAITLGTGIGEAITDWVPVVDILPMYGITNFPDASTTGIVAGTVLSAPETGSIHFQTPGEVVEGRDFTDLFGNVRIEADNVTLRNCRIANGDSHVIQIMDLHTGTVIENCDISGMDIGGTGILGSGTFRRNHIHNCGDGISIDAGTAFCEIVDNYIHDLSGPDTTHFDGIVCDGNVSNVTIRHNTVINPQDQTSAITVDNFWGPIDKVTVDHNLVGGGDYAIYLVEKATGQNPGGPVTNVRCTDNHILPGSQTPGDFNVDFEISALPVMYDNVNDGAALIAKLQTTGQPADNAPVFTDNLLQYADNPELGGTAGAKTGSGTITGDVADGWTAETNDTGIAVTASKTTLNGADAQRFVVSGTNTTNHRVVNFRNSIVYSGQIGEQYEAWVEYSLAAGAANLQGFYITGPTGTSPNSGSSDLIPANALSGVIRIPPSGPLTATDDSFNFQMVLRFADGEVAADITWAKPFVRKIANP